MTTLQNDTPAAATGGPASLPARMVAAWAVHDAEAIADLFLDEGTMILPGVHQVGRDAIAAFMAGAFAGPYAGTRVYGTPIGVTPLAPGAVIVFTRGGVLYGEEDVPTPENTIHAAWTAVERDGAWKLAAYQNSPANAA